MEINENITQLELTTLFDKLREFIISPYGNKPFEELQLLHDANEVRARLNEVSEMQDLIISGYHVPLSELEDIRPLLNQLAPEDSFLEALQLNQVKANLEAFYEIHRFIINHQESCKTLTLYARRIHAHRAIIREIERVIDIRGEIKDDASPELRLIRSEIRRLENEQKGMLNRILKRYKEFSQDDIITLRDGRMVLGIQQQYVNRINGIVHGTSGSGATVFIEPMETLRISNQIQNLKIEERKEIIRILQFLSGLIREVREDILYGIENYGWLDFIHAKARLSIALQAVAPKVVEEPRIRLKNARHPLLLLKMGHQNVVPCDLTLGEDYYTLVITGPNAGGKTVTLKTVGLLLLMTQFGIPIPADPDSEIPLMDNLLVDIGDRQNLEQDLSTFSAHILRLQEIFTQANSHTLVLVDEIGSGTDPREGAALAISFLQELTERKALTIATTHHGELKAFAYATEGVENASMAFNLDTLQPTYQLQIGIPGSSYAFEIARRYGLSELVLKRAEDILGADRGQLENLILKLNHWIQEVEKERRELNVKLSEVEGLKILYKNQVEKLRKEKTELLRQAAEEARQLVEEARTRIENVVKELRKHQANKEKIKEAHKVVGELKKSIEEILKETSEKKKSSDRLHKGDIVWIEHLREEGELLSEPDENAQVWVLIGSIKMKLEASHLRKLNKQQTTSSHVFKKESDRLCDLKGGVLPELDLRGLDSFEAIQTTDRYLDRALEEGWEEVRIIHGKGTGVLRRTINQFLSKDKRVEEKRLGKWGEGDTGVTIVKLKK